MSKYWKHCVPLLFALMMWLPMTAFAQDVQPAQVLEVNLSGTGNAEVDLPSSDPLVITVADPLDDLAKPGNCNTPNDTGWNIKDLRFKLFNDVATFAVNSNGISGDVDGDGDAGKLTCATFGTDYPFFGGTEYVSVILDINKDNTPDYVIGVSANGDLTKFGLYQHNGQLGSDGFVYGQKVSGVSINLFAYTGGQPNVQQPDLIFEIKGFSKIFPDLKVTAFQLRASNGSLEDTVGEDGVPSIVATQYVSINPPAIIGDYVWNDQDNDGQQGQNEVGLTGLKVELWRQQNCTAAPVFITTTNTTATGYYSFTVNPGGYQIRFGIGSRETYTYTIGNVGADDSFDSDVNSNGITACMQVLPGETNLTIDAGLWQPARIGDYCWEDRNYNGLQDMNEPPVQGCEVQMRKADGTPIKSVLTDEQGFYRFEVPSGQYCLFAELPDGSDYTAFTYLSMGDLMRDSNVEHQSGRLGCYNLKPGDNRVDVDLGVLPLPANPLIREKSVNPVTVEQGKAMTFTVVASNDGPGVAYNSTITDTIPMSLTLVAPPNGCQFNRPDLLVCELGDLAMGQFVTLTYEVIAPTQVVSDTLFTNRVEIHADGKNTNLGDDIRDSDVLVTVNETPDPVPNYPCFLPIVIVPGNPPPPPADPCIAYRELPVEVKYMKPVTWTQNSLGEWEAIGVYTTTKQFTLQDGDTRTVADVSFLPGYRTCLRNLSNIPWYVKIYGTASSYLPSVEKEICYDPKPGDAALLKKFNVTWGPGNLAMYDGRPESCQAVAGVEIDVDP